MIKKALRMKICGNEFLVRKKAKALTFAIVAFDQPVATCTDFCEKGFYNPIELEIFREGWKGQSGKLTIYLFHENSGGKKDSCLSRRLSR